MTTTANDQLDGLGTYKFGWADSDTAGETARASHGSTHWQNPSPNWWQ